MRILFRKQPCLRVTIITAGIVLMVTGGIFSHALGTSPSIDPVVAEGRVLMIRHALAPGTGDPDNFSIEDCSTQRNLNDQGRSQARDIGRWLRQRGFESARIYSSQWCRCIETATLLGLGTVHELPALNSFFERPQDRETNLSALRDFLSKQPLDGDPIILVTHYVTIAGVTGEGVSSGEGVMLRLTGDGGFEVLGRLPFDN
jgi:phosphohistidine phosphatase SixA